LDTLINLGYFGLFLASFLAATVVPFSSEAIFAAMIFGPFDVVVCLLVATLGNWLGGLTSFGLGWLGRAERVERFLKINPEKVKRFDPYVKRWGVWLAFFCWLPFVGDVLAVALGFARTHFGFTALLMLLGKAARYGVVAYWAMGVEW
jgi:membrane protein YqaA with SNARE-associated domain